MNIDDKISSKQQEIRDNHEWLSKSEFLGETSPGQPIKMNSSKDLIEYAIHTNMEELLNTELDILLEQKFTNNLGEETIKLLNQSAHDFRNEITVLKLKLEE